MMILMMTTTTTTMMMMMRCLSWLRFQVFAVYISYHIIYQIKSQFKKQLLSRFYAPEITEITINVNRQLFELN